MQGATQHNKHKKLKTLLSTAQLHNVLQVLVSKYNSQQGRETSHYVNGSTVLKLNLLLLWSKNRSKESRNI